MSYENLVLLIRVLGADSNITISDEQAKEIADGLLGRGNVMTVAELEKILAAIVEDGKGNYQVDTYDWDVGTVSVDDDNQYVTLTM